MRRTGFTLIELLVVTAVIVSLMALAAPVVSRALESARLARERASGRTLMIGFLNYAMDHNGELLRGYTRNVNPSQLPVRASGEAAYRYPLRLIPYIGDYDKRILVADGRGWHVPLGQANEYLISLFPSFGMNTYFVGGDESGNESGGVLPTPAHFARFGKFCVTQLGEAHKPSSLIVFASARGEGDGKLYSGYFKALPPILFNFRWSDRSFDAARPPRDHGHVDFRYRRMAVFAHLDGHVAILNEKEARDMRRWSNLAALADDPHHQIR